MGEVYDETHFVLKGKSSFTWKIVGFSICPYVCGEYFDSKEFIVEGCDQPWYLEIYPKGEESESEGLPIVYLNAVQEISRCFIQCELFLINASGQKLSQCKSAEWRSGYPLIPMSLPALSELLEQKAQVLPDDTLTLQIDVSIVYQIDSANATNFSLELRESTLAKQRSLAGAFARLFQDKENADVVLIVGNDEISAHKLVLMCRSPVFASMFGHDMIERNTNRVHIEDVKLNVLSELLRFLYTDKVDFCDVTFAVELFAAADKYDIDLLRARCALYLARNISEDTVSSILDIADVCNDVELRTRCEKFVEQHNSVDVDE